MKARLEPRWSTDLVTERPARIVLVEHHHLVRAGLEVLTKDSGELELVASAPTLAAGVQTALSENPHVVLVAARLPDGSGIDLIRELRARKPDIRCLVFTHAVDDEVFFQSVIAGAAGCLTNDIDLPELTQAVLAVADGETLVTPERIDELRGRAVAHAGGNPLIDRLTPQERRILSMVSHGMTNREISEALSLAEKTIRNYMSSVLGKLGMRNRTELAAFVARSFPPK